MANIALNQAVTGGVASTSFFNGRLLSAEDLLAEQTSNRQARQILGQAIGDGVAWGLLVSESTLGSPPSSPTVSISAGVAVSRGGLGLRLTQGVDVLLTTPPDPAAVPSNSGFSACQPPQQGVYITGEGAYLLVISPASFRDGQAPANGFGGINSACTTRSVVNTVQFRLLPLPGADLSDGNKARNRIAYQCTAAASLVDAASDPYGPGVTRTSLIDNLRPAFLTDCDVPLAVISWSILGGIRFVDNWSVRRRLTGRLEQGPFLKLARRLEMEAMIAQFDDQIRTMAVREANLPSVALSDRFETLPPIGMVPVRTAVLFGGFDATQFFGELASRDVAMLDAQGLRALHAEALNYEPVRVASSGPLQLYQVFENVKAIERGDSRQAAIVFASPALPYRGVARFGYATWGLSRFTGGVI